MTSKTADFPRKTLSFSTSDAKSDVQVSEKPTARQPARGRQRPSGCDPQDYHPPDLLLEELTQLWPQIPPHLQVCLLELARQFAS